MKITTQLVMQNTNQKQMSVVLWFRLYDKHCFGVDVIVLCYCGYYILRFQVLEYLRV